MATHITRVRAAAVILLILAVTGVIVASAFTWHADETTDIRGNGPASTHPTIFVEAGSHLQYLPNLSARTVANSYLPSKATAIPYKIPSPVPTSQPVTTISIPSTGTSVTPLNGYLPGYSGRVPVRPNLTKGLKFPVSQQKPSVIKPVTTLKPPASVFPLPTVLPPTPTQPVPATIIVNDTTHQVEQRILYYTNIERANAGKPPLKWDEQLAVIGRDDCVDMAARGFFDHINPDGETPADRAARHGYPVEKDFGTYVRVGVGENIAMLSSYQGSPDEVAKFIVDAWMNSPGHRANIVDSFEQKFTLIGVGVAYDDADDTWYAAQEFF